MKYEKIGPAELVGLAVAQLGSKKAVAAAIGCSRFALRLWERGERSMLPAYRKLLIDVLDRPRHYAKYKVLSRPPVRPTADEAEAYNKAARKLGVKS